MFGFDDLLTYGGAAVSGGSKLAGGLAGLLKGNPAALASSVINLIPTAMSTAGTALGGSAGAGLSSLASGVAPALGSALSVYAGPAAIAAYIGARALTNQMQAKGKQAQKQMREIQDAQGALPARIAARAAGAGALGSLGTLTTPEALQQALGAAQGGIQGDLEQMGLQRALGIITGGPGTVAREVYGDKVPATHPELNDLSAALTGPMATDNYLAQIALTDTASRQGLDTEPYTQWSYQGGGGQALRDNSGNITGYQPGEDEGWTWDDDFLNNAVATLGQRYGIDDSRLPGSEMGVVTEGGQAIRDNSGNILGWQNAGPRQPGERLKLTAADLPGWAPGHYTQAVHDYLRSLDPTIETSEAYQRNRSLPGLAALLGGG